MKYIYTLIIAIILSSCSDATSDQTLQLTSKTPKSILFKTSQTTTYISGDDGDYQNGIIRKFILKDGIIVEKILNLMWQDALSVSTDRYNWNNANSYCQNLTYKNYSDWRLPTRDELLSIINYTLSPSIFSVFNYTAADNYWSSTIDISAPGGYRWSINFNNATSDDSQISQAFFVRCTRDNTIIIGED